MAKVKDDDILEDIDLDDESENVDTETEQETAVPTAPFPPNPADTNPLWPKIEEEKFNRLVLSSDAYPTKRLILHYPTKREEVKIRGSVRKLAFEMELSPEELDTWSQNNFYVSALLQHACDNEQPVDWMEISPDSRKAEEALDATVALIINWRFSFSDADTP